MVAKLTTCYNITLMLDPQPEGGFTVTCEELPELITEGDSVDEALHNSVDAFVTVLELYEDFGRTLPDSIQSTDHTPSIHIKQENNIHDLFDTMNPKFLSDNQTTPYFFKGTFPTSRISAHGG